MPHVTSSSPVPTHPGQGSDLQSLAAKLRTFGWSSLYLGPVHLHVSLQQQSEQARHQELLQRRLILHLQNVRSVEELHLLCGIQPGKKPDLSRLLLAYKASHLSGPISRIKAAHLRACLPKDCIVCCYLHAASEFLFPLHKQIWPYISQPQLLDIKITLPGSTIHKISGGAVDD